MSEWKDHESLVNPLRRRGARSGEATLDNPRVKGLEPRFKEDRFYEIPATETSVPKETPKPVQSTFSRPQSLLVRRGHTFSYIGLFIFTVVLYFRPYELFSSLSWLSRSAFWIALATLIIFLPTQLALEGNFTARPREINLILILTVLALISIPVGSNPTESWTTFNDTFIKAVVIFIVMINVVRTERRLNALIYLSFAVSLLLSIIALRDYMSGNLSVEGYRVKPLIGGIFGNPNDMAIHLVTMVPIAVGMAIGSKKIFKKLILFVCALCFVGAIVVTYSRGGFLGLVGSSLFLVWALSRSKGRRRNNLAIVGFVLAAAVLLIVAPGNYIARILSIVGLAADPMGSVSARKTLLIHSIIVMLRNPFGVGMGNYRYMAPHDAVNHNAYTQVATEMGILALIVYVLFMVTSFRRLKQITYDDSPFGKRAYYLGLGLKAGLIGYMISSFFASVAYQWYVYYLVGFSFALWRIVRGFSEQRRPEAVKT
jgi:hypothetical protein